MREPSTRPTVAFNGRFLMRPQSGVQRVAGQLLRALDRQLESPQEGSPAMELVCPSHADTAELELQAIGVRRSGIGDGSQMWEQFQLPLITRDALLVNLCNSAPLLSAGGITMMHDAQVHLSPRSYSPAFVSWYRFAGPRVARRAARILTVSNFSKAMLVKYGVAEEEKIRVVHNGVDHLRGIKAETEVVRRLGLAPKGFVLGMSSGQPHKNLELVLKAFASSTLSMVPLVLYGDRPDTLPGRATPPNVVFAGRVSDEELKGLIEAATMFVFPSLTEGFGLPPLEAMSLGCPAVVAPCGALPEVCGDAALYADAADPAAWASAVRFLLDDSKARAEWAARGLARADDFPWSASARQLLAVIEDVQDEMARRAPRGHG